MSKSTVKRRIKALLAEWDTLRFALSERDAAEAWAESMALHEDVCPAAHPTCVRGGCLVIQAEASRTAARSTAPSEVTA